MNAKFPANYVSATIRQIIQHALRLVTIRQEATDVYVRVAIVLMQLANVLVSIIRFFNEIERITMEITADHVWLLVTVHVKMILNNVIRLIGGEI